jgi:hypothetical protein
MTSSFAGPNSSSLFFFFFFLKGKGYNNCSRGLDLLKGNFRVEIAKLPEETLEAVMRSFVTRVQLCNEGVVAI